VARIAIIGSGIAGLTAAWLCRQQGWQVQLFEQQSVLGMLTHGLEVDGGLVDVPLRVMNARDWSSLLGMSHELGVETFSVQVDTTCSWSDGRTWFRSGRMPLTNWPMVGAWRFVNADAMRIGQGLRQLARVIRQLQARDAGMTLADLLDREPFEPKFWRGLMLPILQTICTCDEDHLLAWPALPLLDLAHGVMHSGDLMRLKGGTRALAGALTDGIPVMAGSGVVEVEVEGDGVRVLNDAGDGGRYDRVIVATQANQIDFLRGDAFERERALLANIPYASGELWVHDDLRFMPGKRRDWGALNFHMDADMHESMFTVWVNAVEPTLEERSPVLQTWNPGFEPEPDSVLARIPMQRAVVDSQSAGVREEVRRWHAQAGRRVFYCGSWAGDGVPLLESAVRSAQDAVGCIAAGLIRH
jgi:uncharacterized protein